MRVEVGTAGGDAAPIVADPAGRVLTIGRHALAVRGPSWRDHRMHVAAVIVTLQVLGQTVLGFEISITQILLCLGSCAAVEVLISLVRDRALAWPGSALLTGNGVAFIFRANGTEHGDWWSTRGAWMFVSCALLSLLSKYAIQVAGRHLFNPSNLGLVVCFLVFGTGRVNPLDLWWGPLSPGLVAAYAVILVGGTTLARRVGMGGVVASSWLALAAGLAVVAASGHAISARWSLDPVAGLRFWAIVVLSPEILVFVFFMVTDPRTSPLGRVGRVAYGTIVGLASAALAAPQTTEFATKVALLAGLLVGCALRPVIEARLPAPGTPADAPWAWVRPRLRPRRLAAVALAGAVVVAGLVAAGAPARPDAVAEVQAGGRPDVAPDAPVPAAAVGDGVDDLAGGLTQAEADRLVTDVAQGLAIEARALAAGDPTLAATASTPARLEELRGAIAAGAPVLRWTSFTEATVVVVRDPHDVQAVPRLGVRLRGARGPDGGPSRPAAVTVVVARGGPHDLIASVVEG